MINRTAQVKKEVDDFTSTNSNVDTNATKTIADTIRTWNSNLLTAPNTLTYRFYVRDGKIRVLAQQEGSPSFNIGLLTIEVKGVEQHSDVEIKDCTDSIYIPVCTAVIFPSSNKDLFKRWTEILNKSKIVQQYFSIECVINVVQQSVNAATEKLSLTTNATDNLVADGKEDKDCSGFIRKALDKVSLPCDQTRYEYSFVAKDEVVILLSNTIGLSETMSQVVISSTVAHTIGDGSNTIEITVPPSRNGQFKQWAKLLKEHPDQGADRKLSLSTMDNIFTESWESALTKWKEISRATTTVTTPTEQEDLASILNQTEVVKNVDFLSNTTAEGYAKPWNDTTEFRELMSVINSSESPHTSHAGNGPIFLNNTTPQTPLLTNGSVNNERDTPGSSQPLIPGIAIGGILFFSFYLGILACSWWNEKSSCTDDVELAKTGHRASHSEKPVTIGSEDIDHNSTPDVVRGHTVPRTPQTEEGESYYEIPRNANPPVYLELTEVTSPALPTRVQRDSKPKGQCVIL